MELTLNYENSTDFIKDKIIKIHKRGSSISIFFEHSNPIFLESVPDNLFGILKNAICVDLECKEIFKENSNDFFEITKISDYLIV